MKQSILLICLVKTILIANDIGETDHKLGVYNFNSGKFYEAEITFANGCYKKHSESCNALAYMYRNGKGITKDSSKALKFYKMACDLLNGKGCYGMALILKNDINSHFKYVDILKKSCKYGFYKACIEIYNDNNI